MVSTKFSLRDGRKCIGTYAIILCFSVGPFWFFGLGGGEERVGVRGGDFLNIFLNNMYLCTLDGCITRVLGYRIFICPYRVLVYGKYVPS